MIMQAPSQQPVAVSVSSIGFPCYGIRRRRRFLMGLWQRSGFQSWRHYFYQAFSLVFQELKIGDKTFFMAGPLAMQTSKLISRS
jgi:hypothetical protein